MPLGLICGRLTNSESFFFFWESESFFLQIHRKLVTLCFQSLAIVLHSQVSLTLHLFFTQNNSHSVRNTQAYKKGNLNVQREAEHGKNRDKVSQLSCFASSWGKASCCHLTTTGFRQILHVGIKIIWWKWISEITWKSCVKVPKKTSNNVSFREAWACSMPTQGSNSVSFPTYH
jgi:hypothetical protein